MEAGLQGLVLIADGEVERAKELAEACSTRGLATRVAPHGAGALEMALAEPPDVVVATLGLPLVDAPQLAAILRANPRTQATRFVLLGGLPGEPLPHVAIDARVPFPLDTDAVVRRIRSLLVLQTALEEAPPRAAGEHDLEGKLSELSLPDLLQLFHLNRKTGAVELTRRAPNGGEERGLVALVDGNVVDARCGAVEGEKALHRLLGWRSGAFAFTRTRPGGAARIHTPTRALLMEGMRQLDELARLQAELPPLDAEVRFRVAPSELPPVVQPLTREVLGLLASFARVGDVVDRSSFPDYQVLRTLQALLERGIVELRRPRGDDTIPLGGALFSASQLGQLREWAQRGRPATGAPCDPRVWLVSPEPDAARALLEGLSSLPEVVLDPVAREGRFSASTLRRLARLGPAQEVGVELFHLPTHARCEPFWSLAAASALAVVYVASCPLAEAAAALAPVRSRLEPGLRARRLFVVLDPGPAPLDADEAASTLDAPDDAPVLLLPTGSGRDPRAALTQLLARLVP